MPRNPDKRRCQKSRCRSWAMRGHFFCRSHLDNVFGSRGAGAPEGNLNAMSKGTFTRPLSDREIMGLAHELAQHPDTIETVLVHIVGKICRRAGSMESDIRAIKIMASLRIVLDPLFSHMANDMFVAGFEEILDTLPPAVQADLKSQVWKGALELHPALRLLEFKKAVQQHQKKTAGMENN